MQIHVYKTGTMHALLTALVGGYTDHISGMVSAERVNAMCEKFHDRYLIDLTPHHRHRRHRQGLGNARLFLHPSYSDPVFAWWLLLTEGDHPARASEPVIHSAVDKRHRLCFQDQYEAVQRPAAGGVLRWTWRMTTPQYEALSSRLQTALRGRGDARELVAALRTLHANSCADALSRIDVLYARQAPNLSMAVVERLVRSNIDLVVHVIRDPTPGGPGRRVAEIAAVGGGGVTGPASGSAAVQ
ncbi:MAG: hypothetical protein RLY86_1879 [Pseudomonadota bacterium]|jgi:hypothetical protein